MAGWLAVPRGSLHWAKAGRSPAKTLEVDGLTSAELALRLGRAAGELEGSVRNRLGR